MTAGIFCAVSGILVMALPVPIIGNNFAEFYREQAKLNRRIKRDKLLERRAEKERALAGTCCAISGLLVLALPVPIIGNQFAEFYKMQKLRERRDKKEKALKKREERDKRRMEKQKEEAARKLQLQGVSTGQGLPREQGGQVGGGVGVSKSGIPVNGRLPRLGRLETAQGRSQKSRRRSGLDSGSNSPRPLSPMPPERSTTPTPRPMSPPRVEFEMGSVN